MGKLLEETQLSMSKFKVGDKVVVKGFESNGEDEVIAAFFTYDGDLKYRTKNHQYCHYFTEDRLKLIEKIEKNMELLIGVTKDENGDWVLNTPKDYEIKEFDGKFKLIKKQPQYPKTFAECDNILDEDAKDEPQSEKNRRRQCQKLYILLSCRDAYWKIAGEEMGLGKPWKPDWCDENKLKYCIECSFGTIDKTRSIVNGCPLAFPIEEMRDAFYENFKELIEECKGLL